MQELIWLNDQILPLAEARIPIEERGFQFGDGVYEVIRVYHGKPFTLREHLDRFESSARGIELEPPMSMAQLGDEIVRLIERSGLVDGMVYAQLTRGVAHRNHLYPTNPRPTLLFYTRELPAIITPDRSPGVTLLTVEDERWRKCWIKSISLLASVLAKNAADRAGADEAVFVENDIVSECSTSNLFAVIGGELITHPVGSHVLPGITRLVVLDCARQLGVKCSERGLSLEATMNADELFITSTTRQIAWVSKWDNAKVGGERCGSITLKLHQALEARVLKECSSTSFASIA